MAKNNLVISHKKKRGFKTLQPEKIVPMPQLVEKIAATYALTANDLCVAMPNQPPFILPAHQKIMCSGGVSSGDQENAVAGQHTALATPPWDIYMAMLAFSAGLKKIVGRAEISLSTQADYRF